MVMQIRRKEVPLLSTFPRPPAPSSPAKPSPGLTRPSDFGFITVNHGVKKEPEVDSLYEDPPPRPPTPTSPPPPPPPERDTRSIPAPAPFSATPSPPTSGHSAELQLVLDQPSKVFSPGDTITGYIVGYSNPTTHIHVFLSGHSTTTLRDAKNENTSHVPLLFTSIHIKPHPHQDGIARFAIAIPLTTDIASQDANALLPQDKDRPESRPYWTTTFPSNAQFSELHTSNPLPPSTQTPALSASTLTYSIKGTLHISYTLIAITSILSKTPSNPTLLPTASHTTPITITKLRLPATQLATAAEEAGYTEIANLSVQTTQLTKQRALSIREHLKDAFAPGTPSFYFALAVHGAGLCAAGAILSVKIAVEVRAPPVGKSYFFGIPDVEVVRVGVKVRAFTGIRVAGASAMAAPATASVARSRSLSMSRSAASIEGELGPWTFRHDEVRVAQGEESRAVFKPQHGAFDGQSCVVSFPLPGDVAPSFKTYNAWRGYSVECVVRVRVAGREVEASTGWGVDIVAVEGGMERANKEGKRDEDGVVRRMAEEVVRKVRLGVDG